MPGMGGDNKSNLRLLSCETFQQALMDIAEASVAEDTDHIAWFGLVFQVVEDGLDIRNVGGGFAGQLEIVHEAVGIEAEFDRQLFEAGDFRDDDGVGPFQRLH